MASVFSQFDEACMALAFEEACLARDEGNLPIGCVISCRGEIVGRGHNRVVCPTYHPGRHAECEALCSVSDSLWAEARHMVLYTTLEPCIMCMGKIILHAVGRVLFGAVDRRGGSTSLLRHLPSYYDLGGVPQWDGPFDPERFDPLYDEVNQRFQGLPCAVVQGV